MGSVPGPGIFCMLGAEPKKGIEVRFIDHKTNHIKVNVEYRGI